VHGHGFGYGYGYGSGNTVNIYGAISQCEWANGTADKETAGQGLPDGSLPKW